MNSSFLKSDKAKRKNGKLSDDKDSAIGLSSHKPTYNASSLNHSIERAVLHLHG